MNILHVKYAVEVAKQGSLNKAAETLLTAQPNISRSIKELEASLGITIFSRSAKGMELTFEGEEFISYAQGILKQIDQVERVYKERSMKKQTFSISVPRASYVAEAFSQLSQSISAAPAEIFYKEVSTLQTIQNVVNNDYRLGIIRYSENYDKYFKEMLDEKGLSYEMVAEFSYVIIFSRDCPLAQKEVVTFEDLSPYIEIAHADPFVPTLTLSKMIKEEYPDNITRRIFVFDRASQFELLSENPETFMLVSPIPDKTLERYELVQKKCTDCRKVYKDMLIYRNGYKLSKLDKLFITELCDSKRKYLIND